MLAGSYRLAPSTIKPALNSSDSAFYNTIDTFLPKLDKADYDVDEKQRTVTLTEAGMEKIEGLLRDAGQLKGESLYDVENVSVVHHINQALRAHTLFTRDKDYICLLYTSPSPRDS